MMICLHQIIHEVTEKAAQALGGKQIIHKVMKKTLAMEV